MIQHMIVQSSLQVGAMVLKKVFQIHSHVYFYAKDIENIQTIKENTQKEMKITGCTMLSNLIKVDDNVGNV